MTTTPDLTEYDVILLNSSAGKDSQAMLSHVVGLADEQGVDRSRIVVVHADLGRVEWEGVRDLAAEQAAVYGLRFEVVERDEDLLDHVETRHATLQAQGKTDVAAWPSSTARWCTSDHKTSQVAKLMTRLADEHRAVHGKTAQVRILNCLGIRAQESPARAKKVPFSVDGPATNGRRHVDRWLPIFDWKVERVWQTIRDSGLRWHPAYDAGMPRLSCCFCVLAGRRELVLAARLNPALAAEYVAVEDRIGKTFRQDLSMAEVVRQAAEPDAPADLEPLTLFDCAGAM
ncbi:MAG: phosphoadenosine phosphosulfate reductase [Flaviaesturariibacter sp.]|nr:phosphoadenosine phosphosulfate reductase [Flaviaesturariibacter sp.]